MISIVLVIGLNYVTTVNVLRLKNVSNLMYCLKNASPRFYIVQNFLVETTFNV